MECSDKNRLVESWIAEELDRESGERFREHLENCSECRDIAELHDRLTAARLDVGSPPRHDLAAVRWSVLGELRRDRAQAPSATKWSFVPMAVAAVLTLMVGFGLGRSSADRGRHLLPSATDLESFLIGTDESPFWVSNVEVATADAGNRLISFDVSRHYEMRRPHEDPLVRRLAVEALRTSSTLGDRLAAVEAANDIDDSLVQATLLETALGDPSLAVRLAALEVLQPSSTTEAGLLEILRSDPSVEMRMRAVDLLASGEVSRNEIQRALDDTDSRGAVAVLRHARTTLQL